MSKRGPSYLTNIEVEINTDVSLGIAYYEDPICGTYAISAFVRLRLDNNIWEKRRLASTLAERVAREFKQLVMILSDQSDTRPAGHAKWSFYTIDELLAAKPLSPLEMIEESLLNLSHRLSHPSDLIRIAPQDCWLLYSYDAASMAYVVDQLCEQGFLKSRGSDPATSYTTNFYALQAKGWEKIASLRTAAASARRQAFIAMWFAPEMEEFYIDGIVPAVEHDGTKCVRIDQKEHNNKICDEIIQEIRRSRYLVADFTGNRGGVYFEAGFAYGLGLPVIWTVRENELDKVHFDTRQYNHLVYKSKEELRFKLSNRIKATIL